MSTDRDPIVSNGYRHLDTLGACQAPEDSPGSRQSDSGSLF